ncbi:SpaA isopeptide-forming pilin-related protein [Bacillus safensis]|uniref:SpaA isopeptide-forming pilin-related protein n=1 Tax=Bacillus safensis TaxID=561879 RepID=UPI00227DE546|nr:SpaA isopeptide-forming pilin-related protein [Bacillus safensis]MCY7493890.1 Ig-like domain-containing protein [Bacillus safensis]MED4991501.1 SpaA isopeptide-forming pilin-related protein [Bacillus safensis]
MDVLKRILALALITVLVIQSSILGILPLAGAQAKDIQENIYGEIEFADSEGKKLSNMEDQQVRKAIVHWSIKGIDLKKQYPYVLTLPSAIQVEKEQKEPITVGDIPVGEYTVSKQNEVTVEFKEDVEIDPNLEGSIDIDVTSITQQEEKTKRNKREESLPKDDSTSSEKDAKNHEAAQTKQNDEDELLKNKVSVSKRAGLQSVSKQMQIQENLLTDAKLIFEDQEGNSVEKPDINSLISINYEWAIPNGHSYNGGDEFHFKVPEELVIYEKIDRLEMKFNQATIGYFSVDESGNASIEFTDFIKQYSNIHGTLQVWTQLDKKTVITEEKEVVITPIEGKDKISIPIQYIPNGPNVSKKGEPNRSYNAETIQWTVDFNMDLEDVKQAKLLDPIQEGQALKKDSIKLYRIDTKLNGETSLGQQLDENHYTIGQTADGQDFTIEFKDDVHLAYRLMYETDITNQDQSAFRNKASLVSGDKVISSAEGTVNVTRGSPLNKKAAQYDPVTQTITWEIRYNYNEKKIAEKDALLEDFFNCTQALISDSIQVKVVTIDQNGNEAGTKAFENYVVQPQKKDEQNGFTLQFNQDIQSAYLINYQTKATERIFESEEIINTVTAGKESKQGKQRIDQQILTKNHGTPNYKTKTIPWRITFNKDQQTMNNVILKDTFTNEGLTLQKDSLKVTTGNTVLEEVTDYQIVEHANGFDIQFTKEIKTEHTVTYTTSFDYEKRADKDQKNLRNHVKLEWVNEDGKDLTKENQSVFTPDTYTQSNGFKNGTYDAKKKEITWNIGVNYNLKHLEEAKIEDFIQGNQRLLKDSITVYSLDLQGGENGAEEKEVLAKEHYDIKFLENEKGETGFEVIFKKAIDSPYKITYQTSVEGMDLVQKTYENKATLYDGQTKESDVNAVVSIPNGGKYTSKSGNQQGKVIDWKLNINFGQSTVQDATIIDHPSSNQAIIENSFHLYSTTIDEKGQVTKAEELEKGKDYELDLEFDPDSFQIKFKEEITRPYILEYQSLILDKVGSTLQNEVTFRGENVKEIKKESEASIVVKRTAGMGDGTGSIGALTVKKVDASSGKALKGASFSLTDAASGIVIGTKTTDEEGALRFDRLLYGDYIVTEEKAPDGYIKTKDPIHVTIDQPYESGDQAKTGNSMTVQNQEIRQHVKLTKKDKETGAALENAEFELKNESGETVQTDLKTDEKGEILFKHLEPGSYYFVETNAPKGYQLNQQKWPFTIKENQTETTIVTAVNDIIKGSAELSKIGEGGERLEGAQFKLLDKDGQELQKSLVTGENGKITINELRPGTYQLVETKAPVGYVLDETPIKFEVPLDPKEPVVISQKNLYETSALEVLKEGEDGKKLQGVRFEVLDQNDEVVRKDLTTDEDGKILVDNLKPGKYQLVETESVDGYQKNNKPYPFTIEIAQKTPAEIKVINDLKTGSVQLTKLGEKDDVLEGAEFKLVDANGKEIKTGLATDQNGKIIVNDLKPGTYQFVETKAPFGHELDETPVTFAIPFNPEKLVSVTKENSRKTGGVLLHKKGEDGKSLEGVVFDLSDDKGKIVAGGEGVTTNQDGKITFTGLKPGTYQFVERKSLEGYELSTKPLVFHVELGQKEWIQVEAVNQLKKGSVELTKIGEEKERLKGAEFTLFNDEGKELMSGLTTNEKGIITVNDLKPDTYQLVETKAPFGHKLDAKPVDFKIDFNPKQLVKVTKENIRTTSAVQLQKKGEDGQLLNGVTFDLLDEHDQRIKKGLKTDKNGQLTVDQLKPGTYRFVETASIAGYELDQTPVTFTIRLGQDKPAKVEMINKLTPGAVELTKVDDEGHTLENAEFALLSKEGKTLKKSLVTDQKGKLHINDLKPGQYQFVETKAPHGYQLDDKPILFTIEKNQQKPLQLTVKNHLILGSLRIIKVDQQTDRTLKGASFDIRTKAGKTIKSVTTGKDGEAIVKGLKPGEYLLTETKAPDGYVALKKPLAFTIQMGEVEIKTMIVKNAPVKNEEDHTNPPASDKGDQHPPHDSNGELPKTGEEWLRYLMYAGILLVASGTVLLVVRRRTIQ